MKFNGILSLEDIDSTECSFNCNPKNSACFRVLFVKLGSFRPVRGAACLTCAKVKAVNQEEFTNAMSSLENDEHRLKILQLCTSDNHESVQSVSQVAQIECSKCLVVQIKGDFPTGEWNVNNPVCKKCGAIDEDINNLDDNTDEATSALAGLFVDKPEGDQGRERRDKVTMMEVGSLTKVCLDAGMNIASISKIVWRKFSPTGNWRSCGDGSEMYKHIYNSIHKWNGKKIFEKVRPCDGPTPCSSEDAAKIVIDILMGMGYAKEEAQAQAAAAAAEDAE